jgi:hypothetical protein
MKIITEDFLEPASFRLAVLFRQKRLERGASCRVVAEFAGIHWSAACRAERGEDTRLSTWEKLFGGLGYRLSFDLHEFDEEYPDILTAESDDRRRRRLEGLCAGKRRFY